MSTEALSDRQLETIGSYVKDHLPELLDGSQPDISAQFFESMGHLIRLEEAINRQGDLTEKLIHQVDKRFDQTDRRMQQTDRRLDQIGKRLDEFSHQIDKRFEQVDRRFEQVEKHIEKIDKRITLMFTVLTAISSLVGAAVVVAQFIA